MTDPGTPVTGVESWTEARYGAALATTYRATPDMIAAAVAQAVSQREPPRVAALLLAALTARIDDASADGLAAMAALEGAFPGALAQDPAILPHYINAVRSGVTGRRSFGSCPKRLIRQWLNAQGLTRLFEISRTFTDPTMGDIIRLTHPRPKTPRQAAMFRYLVGKGGDVDIRDLPPAVLHYERQKHPMFELELDKAFTNAYPQ